MTSFRRTPELNNGEADMPSADVTSQPLAVNFTFSPKVLTDAATSNSQYQVLTWPWSTVKMGLSQEAQMKFQVLDQLTTTALGKIIDAQWAQDKADAQKQAVTFIGKNHPSVSNVAVNLTDPGPVTATVTPAATPGGDGELTLEFTLKGCELTLDDPALVNWADVFDVIVTLTTPVPVLPFGFVPALTAEGSNAEVSPNNLLAAAAEWGDNFLTGIWNFLSGGNYVSDVELAEEGLEIETDAALPAPSSAIEGVLNQLNSAGPDVLVTGFTQFAFSIENGNTLTGTLTHPLDPGPQVIDVTHPEAGGGINFMLPELSASESVVPPGGPFNAAGKYFPWASSGQLYLEWLNTTSGAAESSEILVAGGGSSKQDTIQAGSGFTGQYIYTATGLQPNVEYTFTARCSDQAAWSLWSDPLKLTTSQGDLVLLMLEPPVGSPYGIQQIGAADLAGGSSDWACAAVIPASAPDGTYTLAAVLNGQTLATTQITVGAVTANIAVIDPSDNQVITNPMVMADTAFTVRGEAFPHGPVILTIAGQPAGTATAVNGSFTVALISSEGTYTSGTFTIAATGGGVTATTAYYQIGKAK
jgi:hypothetical protein